MLEINEFDRCANIDLRRERALERALYNMRYLDNLRDCDKVEQNKAVESCIVDIMVAIEPSITGDEDELKVPYYELLNDLCTIMSKWNRGESVYFLGKHAIRKWLFSLEDLRERSHAYDVMAEHGVDKLNIYVRNEEKEKLIETVEEKQDGE